MDVVVVQIAAPHFCAAIVARDGKCVEAAPILRYMIGWDGKQVAAYCVHKHWSWWRA